MSSLELQQAREIQQAPTSDSEHKKSGVSGDTNTASKPSTKPQKGIMGMFGNKTAPKNQDKGKDIKSEQKEDAPVVRLCILWFDYLLHTKKQMSDHCRFFLLLCYLF